MKERKNSLPIPARAKVRPAGSLVVASCLALAASLTATEEARAESYRNGTRGKLPVCTWPQAPRQIQIVDERDKVIDCRTPDEEDNQEIVIPPMPGSAANSGSGRGVKYMRRGLSNVGFSSNIPARGLPVGNLPPVQIGGLSPIDQGNANGPKPRQIRPIGLANGGKGSQETRTSVAATPRSKPTITATYGPDYRPGGSLTLDARLDQSIAASANVKGTLVNRQK